VFGAAKIKFTRNMSGAIHSSESLFIYFLNFSGRKRPWPKIGATTLWPLLHI